MIQDIKPHVYHNEYRPQPPIGENYVLYYEGKEAFVKMKDEQIDFPTFSELEEENEGIYESAQYLFTIDEQRYYLINKLNPPKNLGLTKILLDDFRGIDPQHKAFAGITGAQLNRWYQDHLYCGHCQTPMVHDEKERMVKCPKCGRMEFPKLCPAVIVAVIHGNRLLLSKYAGRGLTNYALIAGFAEIGESIEDTVRREVMEEVGLKVGKLHYYKSQPWSFSDTLLFGFYAELEGGEDITLDREELAMAEWFEREEIPVEPSRASLTNEMIMRFKRGEV